MPLMRFWGAIPRHETYEASILPTELYLQPTPLLQNCFFPWLLWQIERMWLAWERTDCKSSHSAQKAWPGPVHTLAKSMEVKAKWEEAIWEGRCCMFTLLPASCPLLHLAFAILGPDSKATMWAQLWLAKDIYPQERWPRCKRATLCTSHPGGREWGLK